jgi:hypothetical protein
MEHQYLIDDGSVFRITKQRLLAPSAAALAINTVHIIIKAVAEFGGYYIGLKLLGTMKVAFMEVQKLNMNALFTPTRDGSCLRFSSRNSPIELRCRGGTVFSLPPRTFFATNGNGDYFLFTVAGERYYSPPVPNVSNGSICMGGGFVRDESTLIGSLMEGWRWLNESEWNTDHWGHDPESAAGVGLYSVFTPKFEHKPMPGFSVQNHCPAISNQFINGIL